MNLHTMINWKFERIDWHRYGNCWSWLRTTKETYYGGNQVIWTWGRIAITFERRRRR